MTDIKKPSFGVYLLVLLFPPGYFFSRKRTGAGIASLIMLAVSIPLFFFMGLGIFVWFANVIWAAWNLRFELMNVQVDAQAKAIAKEMASQMNEQKRNI
jgi:hypothetical protein